MPLSLLVGAHIVGTQPIRVCYLDLEFQVVGFVLSDVCVSGQYYHPPETCLPPEQDGREYTPQTMHAKIQKSARLRRPHV